MRRHIFKAAGLLILLGGLFLLVQSFRPGKAKDDVKLQAKSLKNRPQQSQPVNAHKPSDPILSRSMLSEDDIFHERLSATDPVESVEYQTSEGWVVDSRYVRPGESFENVVVRKVFSAEGDDKALYSYSHLADEIVLSMSHSLSDDEIRELENEYRVKLIKKLDVPSTYQFRINELSLKNLIATREKLENYPAARASEYNGLQFSTATPNDPYFKNGLMWGLQNEGKLRGQDGSTFQKGLDLGVTKLWDKHTDCTKVPVAVLDTGVDYNHPDLAGVVDREQSRNFSAGDSKAYMDEGSHGTHVAGTIGALGNNNLGTSGICWKAKILALKVLGNGGTNSAIAEAIVHFAKSSARVANMSLGSKSPPSQVSIDAVKVVEKADKLIVCSAGNDNLNVDTNNRPYGNIQSDHIIVVAAIDGNGKKASFSNYGVKNVDIASPGVQIWSTVPKGSAADYSKAYKAMGGTSMASPHVAGAVSMIWSHSPSLDALSVRKVFLDFAEKRSNLTALAPQGRVLNMAKIVDALQPSGKISESLKAIELKQSNSFEVPITVQENYVKIKSIEILDGETSLGMATMIGNKVTISVPTDASELKIRLKITDADGNVSYTEAISVKTEKSKSASFDQIPLDDFLGEVACQLKDDKTNAVLFDKKLVSKEFCQKICRMILPMVHSTQANYSCGEVL